MRTVDVVRADSGHVSLVWKNLLLKLEPLLIQGRQDRLEREKTERLQTRNSTISRLWQGILVEWVGETNYSNLQIAFPSDDDINALEPVATLLAADTDDVSEEDWDKISEDVEVYMICHHHAVLEYLCKILDGEQPSTDPLHPTFELQNPPPVNEVNHMTERLYSIESLFVCNANHARNCSHWYPRVLNHLANHWTIHTTDCIAPLSKLDTNRLVPPFLEANQAHEGPVDTEVISSSPTS